MLKNHICQSCLNTVVLFEPFVVKSNAERQSEWYSNLDEEGRKELSKQKNGTKPLFPPKPLNQSHVMKTIRGFCQDIDPSNFIETGCAVYGQLHPLIKCRPLHKKEIDLSILHVPNVTRKERKSIYDPVCDLRGPVLASGCTPICEECFDNLSKSKMPGKALAQGLWIGDIPNELKNLRFAEKLLIARVRHSRCLVKVASGRYKMKANIMCFSNPVEKIYNILPPGRDDLDEMIAFMFTGPLQPTPEQLRDTPLLVRRAVVKRALEWLKLNHKDDQDIIISKENLESYDEESVPLPYEYHYQENNVDPLSLALTESAEDDGSDGGPCPVRVHGITGEDFGNMTSREMRATAI
ncbi:hypothetical protein K435DRAFT_651281, partial [Dendrothele bispora CBS 962.96]